MIDLHTGQTATQAWGVGAELKAKEDTECTLQRGRNRPLGPDGAHVTATLAVKVAKFNMIFLPLREEIQGSKFRVISTPKQERC